MTSREGAQDHISEATRYFENVGDITEWGEGKEHSRETGGRILGLLITIRSFRGEPCV
jgi:hypothetical protein